MILWQPTLHPCSADILVQLFGQIFFFFENLMNFGVLILLREVIQDCSETRKWIEK